MRSLSMAAFAAATAVLSIPSIARANEDAAELWINPSVAIGVDDDTAIEIETAQRFRSSTKGPDTYFVRAWIVQDVADGLSLAGALEQRVNDGDPDERRIIQQVSARSGIARLRVRTEQRFVEDADRMGLRLRVRAGVSVPLDAEGRWSVVADAEPFFTLRSTSKGGQDGLTGLRTQLGVSHDLNDRLSVGLVYLRAQDIRRNRVDRVGHAPLLSLEYAF